MKQQRDLRELPPYHQRMSWDTRIARLIAPNEVLWFENVIVVEIKQSMNGDDYAVNVNAVSYAAEQEETTPGVQGYIRLLRRDGSFAAQTTVRSYLRNVEGFRPRESVKEGFGPYIWVDEFFHPSNDGSHANYADDPPWVSEEA